jgi:cadmium resistance protein CadD (predicted permease)
MEIIFTSLFAFASTNLDDIFILALFFGSRQFNDKEIVAGQFLGISALVAVSWVGSFIGFVVSPAYIGLLGIMPVYLGVKGIIQLVKRHHEDLDLSAPSHRRPAPSHRRSGTLNKKRNPHPILSVAMVTIANGGDNISIYLPLFATLSTGHQLTMTIVFLVMTAVWCALAKYVTQHPLLKNSLNRYGHIVTPFVLILLGLYILYESGTFHLLGF